MQNMDLVSCNMSLSPTGGKLLYINASDYRDRHEFWIEWDQHHADRLHERAKRILSTDAKDLKPEGLYKDDCKYCNHTALCSAMIRQERNGENYDDELKAAGANLFGQRKGDDG